MLCRKAWGFESPRRHPAYDIPVRASRGRDVARSAPFPFAGRSPATLRGMDARERLLADRAEALGRLGDLDVSFDDIVEAARDSNIDDEHDPEGRTVAAERALVDSLSDVTRRHLVDIERALLKLDDGTYGVCERCGERIDEARLDARPAARTCITCA